MELVLFHQIHPFDLYAVDGHTDSHSIGREKIEAGEKITLYKNSRVSTVVYVDLGLLGGGDAIVFACSVIVKLRERMAIMFQDDLESVSMAHVDNGRSLGGLVVRVVSMN